MENNNNIFIYLDKRNDFVGGGDMYKSIAVIKSAIIETVEMR